MHCRVQTAECTLARERCCVVMMVRVSQLFLGRTCLFIATAVPGRRVADVALHALVHSNNESDRRVAINERRR